MKILSATGGIASTNSFLIADETSGDAILFDAPDHTVSPLLDAVEQNGWRLNGLWLTHGHFDHTADHKVVTDRFPGVKVWIHRLDEPRLIEPNKAMLTLPFEIPSRKADAYIEDGKVTKIGSIEVIAWHTPGHSPGHIAFHLPRKQVIVGGDLIIGGSVGRTDFPGCDERAMAKSLKKLAQLPPETTLLPGHGAITTIGEEVESNAALQSFLNRV